MQHLLPSLADCRHIEEKEQLEPSSLQPASLGRRQLTVAGWSMGGAGLVVRVSRLLHGLVVRGPSSVREVGDRSPLSTVESYQPSDSKGKGAVPEVCLTSRRIFCGTILNLPRCNDAVTSSFYPSSRWGCIARQMCDPACCSWNRPQVTEPFDCALTPITY